MKNILSSIVAAIAVSVVVCALFVSAPSSPKLGGSINTVLQSFGAGLSVGETGNALSNIIASSTATCTTGASTSTISAQKSAEATCTITGARVNDKVITFLSSNSALGLRIATSSIISANTLQVSFYNGLTSANVSLTGATTGIPYIIYR